MSKLNLLVTLALIGFYNTAFSNISNHDSNKLLCGTLNLTEEKSQIIAEDETVVLNIIGQDNVKKFTQQMSNNLGRNLENGREYCIEATFTPPENTTLLSIDQTDEVNSFCGVRKGTLGLVYLESNENSSKTRHPNLLLLNSRQDPETGLFDEHLLNQLKQFIPEETQNEHTYCIKYTRTKLSDTSDGVNDSDEQEEPKAIIAGSDVTKSVKENFKKSNSAMAWINNFAASLNAQCEVKWETTKVAHKTAKQKQHEDWNKYVPLAFSTKMVCKYENKDNQVILHNEILEGDYYQNGEINFHPLQ